jgi:[acyl-carrier-protein] S-malonyltransferase
VIASLYIGQGVDLPWVDSDVLAQPVVRDYVALASEQVRCDVMKLLARGGRDLARAEIVQPAMVGVCLGVQRLLEQAGVVPSIVLGHSLGELTAWAAAGGIRDADAIALAATRGRLMAREAALHPGGMVRLKGDRAAAERAVADVGGSLWLAAHNGPDEHALAGDEAALARVIASYPAVRLAIAGPWHCPAMAGAVDEFALAVAAVPQQPLRAQLIVNRDGSLANAATIAAQFVGQLVHPVQWMACATTLARLEPRRILAVGPGKTLRALVHKNLGVGRDVEMIDSMRAVEVAARA